MRTTDLTVYVSPYLCDLNIFTVEKDDKLRLLH